MDNTRECNLFNLYGSRVELSKAKRLLAENKNQMKNIWFKEEEETHATDKFK